MLGGLRVINNETKERLWDIAINADEIPEDDEIMQDSKWDEIYNNSDINGGNKENENDCL